jgi:CBS domain-containing protein
MLTAMIVSSASRTYLVSGHLIGHSAENAPALSVMTDFAVDATQTVSEDRHIDEALHEMILAGVRALVVVREGEVAGLITAHDILGEKPVKFLQDPLCTGNPCTHREIAVGDIMTRLGWLETLELKWVLQASARDLAAVFASNSCTHMFVMEPGNFGGVRSIRGLISRTRLERHLGASTPMYLR